LERVQDKAFKMVAGLKGKTTLRSVQSLAYKHRRPGEETRTWLWTTNSYQMDTVLPSSLKQQIRTERGRDSQQEIITSKED
jgi:hypothetical protein